MSKNALQDEKFLISKAEAQKRLHNLLSSTTAFRIFEVQEPELSNHSDVGYDLLFQLQHRTTGKTLNLLVKVEKNLPLRLARKTISKLKEHPKKRSPDEDYYHLIIAPSLHRNTQQLLEEEKIGWVDFGSNAHLEFSSQFIHIEGRPVPKPHRTPPPEKSLYALKSSRILRVLLQGPLRHHKVENLAETADVSLGLVSKIRRILLDHELAKDSKQGIIIQSPRELLDRWQRDDHLQKRTQIKEYSTLRTGVALAEKIVEFQKQRSPNNALFTLNFAASLRAPHNVPTSVSAYLSTFPNEEEWLNFFKARPVPQGAGNLRLIIPSDYKALTIDQQRVKSFINLPLVSDLQLYLDLHGGEPNGIEQARALRSLSNFNGGWS